MDLTIRTATNDDLPILVGELGQEPYFLERLARQHQQRGRLFIASVSNIPVGDVYVSLEDADEPEVRQHLPQVALIQHLEVRSEQRNRGIGTALIAEAEQFLFRHGHLRVSLGVALDNPKAAAWYQRQGYRPWEQPPITTIRAEYLPDGTVRHSPERCQIYVKSLVQPDG